MAAPSIGLPLPLSASHAQGRNREIVPAHLFNSQLIKND